jgi:hypothetical protein
MYVIKRTDQGGGYLQPSGSRKSFGRLATAQTFFTREDAARECCPDNERPIALSDIMVLPKRR